jgi:hypothetical protein
MNRAFEVGREYGVLHIGDRTETVLITSRGAKTVTLGDGRKARILAGIAPDGGGEEVIRLGERGPVAFGGVVRACHIREARS